MGKEQELLKPCPFCGGAMQHRFALWPSEGDRDAIIHAEPTNCPIEGAFSIDTFDNGVSVAEAWNRRSSSDEAEVVAVPAASLLAIRDALLADDLNEAYHQLYTIADPEFCQMEPWRNLEHEAALASPSGVKAGVTEDRVALALDVRGAVQAERNRCIGVASRMAGGDPATCLAIAEEIRCPDIETKRLAMRPAPSYQGDAK